MGQGAVRKVSNLVTLTNELWDASLRYEHGLSYKE